MTQGTYGKTADCRFDGMTIDEARRAGYEAASCEAMKAEELLAKEDPEAYNDLCTKRALTQKALQLWAKYGYDWRIKRHEFTFYEDIKRKLKLGKAIPSHTQIKFWRESLLLECTCEGDVLELVSSMTIDGLRAEVSFIENWLQYDCSYTTMKSWCYDIRQILRFGGIDENYEGDIIEHPEDYHKPSAALRSHRAPKEASFGFARCRTGGNENSIAAAIY